MTAMRLGRERWEAGDLAGAADAFHDADALPELVEMLREQGKLDDAVSTLREAIRWHDPRASALLADLLESAGDQAGAEAARSHEQIVVQLLAALAETGHNYTVPRAQRFAPYVAALLGATEQVELIGRATLRVAGSPAGYLVLTNERLLLLDDLFYPDTIPGTVDRSYHPLFPRYEFVVIDRAAISQCAPPAEESPDEKRGLLVVRFDEHRGSVVSASGEPIPTGELTFSASRATLASVVGALAG